jgi:uncharacterized protein (TIGR00303 family)
MSKAIKIYTELATGKQWLSKYRGCKPVFVCVLGFTSTGLIPGISAAGATPEDRRYTALADAEFLVKGAVFNPKYPLPPLAVGASPVLISRAVVEAFALPIYLFNAGLPQPPAVPAIDLGGVPANCVTSGKALPITTVKHLYQQGLEWGKKLAAAAPSSYLILGECVVGGTTTALALLTGLGINAQGMVNSSHPICNHQQKWSVVEEGLSKASAAWGKSNDLWFQDPLKLVAAVGDPMQIVVAGMALAASSQVGVMLAGGTQMLAVYALIKAINRRWREKANLDKIVVGTTRWVVEDPTGDAVSLAKIIGPVPLLATKLSFATSNYPSLQAYERGYVKEGVGAGGSAIAAHLQGWTPVELLTAVETMFSRLRVTSLGQ